MPIRWNKKAKRYQDERGRFVSKRKIRHEIDKMVQQTGKRLENLSKKLIGGEITVAEWQASSRRVLKAGYTVAASVAKGGWKQMSQSDWGKVGAATKKQYAYLNRFASQLENLSDKHILWRSKLYASSVRTVYHQSELDASSGPVKRVLNAMESCSECVAWAGKGYIPASEMAEIGSLLCGSNCRCGFVFKN